MDKVKEALKQVDMVFEKPEEFKELRKIDEAGNIVDAILDNMENQIDHEPEQMSGEDQVKSVEDEMSKDTLTKEQKVAKVKEWLVSEEGTAYKQFFQSMLKKHGYNSPGDIPADKKKEFFNAIDKGWKGKKEVKEGVYYSTPQWIVHAAAVTALSVYAIKQRVNYCKEKHKVNKKDPDGYKECLWGWIAKKKKEKKKKK